MSEAKSLVIDSMTEAYEWLETTVEEWYELGVMPAEGAYWTQKLLLEFFRAHRHDLH